MIMIFLQQINEILKVLFYSVWCGTVHYTSFIVHLVNRVWPKSNSHREDRATNGPILSKVAPQLLATELLNFSRVNGR